MKVNSADVHEFVQTHASHIQHSLRAPVDTSRYPALRANSVAFSRRLAALFAIGLLLSACSTERLRTPSDLNANLIEFGKVTNGRMNVTQCRYSGQQTLCYMTAVIPLTPPMRLEVTEVVTGPKGSHDKVLPSIARWDWDIPDGSRTLGTLSRADLIVLDYFRLAGVPVCNEPGYVAVPCGLTKLDDWWNSVDLGESATVASVFRDPAFILHVVNIRDENGLRQPTYSNLCAGITRDAGAWSAHEEDPDTDATPTHSIRFTAMGADQRVFEVFAGSNWTFSGKLHTLPEQFDNQWIAAPRQGVSVDRYYGRADVSVMIPVDKRNLPIPRYVPLCTTIADIGEQLRARGYHLYGVARQCERVPTDLLHIETKKGKGTYALEAVAANGRRETALRNACTKATDRVVLRFVQNGQRAIAAGRIDIPDNLSTLAGLLVAENDTFIVEPIR